MKTNAHGMVLVAALLAAAPGCDHDRLYFTDGIDLVFDFSLFTGPGDALNSPYVVGARMRIYLNTTDSDQSLAGWRLDTDPPGLLDVVSQSTPTDGGYLEAECVAVAPGDLELRAIDRGGRVRHTERVRVAVPDRAVLVAHGPMLIGRDGRMAEARILAGGTATYLVEYFAGDEVLRGNGALGVTTTAAVDAEPRRTYLFEDREWLTLTAGEIGESDVTISAGGYEIGALHVVAVPETDVDRIAIEGQDESRADDGDWLVVLAQAYDALDRRIFGVEYEWAVDGVEEMGEGDLYRYEFVAGAVRQLDARFGDHEASVEIQAGEGYVDSSNDLGCAIGAIGAAAGSGASGAGARGARTLPAVTLLGLALATLASRRRRVTRA